MKRTTKGFYGLLIIGALSLAVLAGCGGGGGGGDTTPVSGKVTLSGTAAAGAPIQNAPISIKDKNGSTKSGTTGADGKYNIEVTGMTAPFLMKVPTAAGIYTA